MMEMLFKKKNKNINEILHIDYTTLTRSEIIELFNEMKMVILNAFREHVGESNAITLDDLFEIVFHKPIYEVELYKRCYWIDIIKEIIRRLRGSNQAFIVHRKKLYFVLKNQDEVNYYQKLCDDDIKKLNGAKIRAQKWIDDKLYDKF